MFSVICLAYVILCFHLILKKWFCCSFVFKSFAYIHTSCFLTIPQWFTFSLRNEEFRSKLKILQLCTKTHSFSRFFWSLTIWKKLDWHVQKQPSVSVRRKRCPENMEQIYGKTPMPKCFATLLKSHLGMGVLL